MLGRRLALLTSTADPSKERISVTLSLDLAVPQHRGRSGVEKLVDALGWAVGAQRPKCAWVGCWGSAAQTSASVTSSTQLSPSTTTQSTRQGCSAARPAAALSARRRSVRLSTPPPPPPGRQAAGGRLAPRLRHLHHQAQQGHGGSAVPRRPVRGVGAEAQGRAAQGEQDCERQRERQRVRAAAERAERGGGGSSQQ